MVCLRNICVNTLHKGDNDDDDNNNNNNNNIGFELHYKQEYCKVSGPFSLLLVTKYPKLAIN